MPIDLSKLKVVAIHSIPRYGTNSHWGCVHDVLAPFGIVSWRGMGAFWHMQLSDLFDHAINEGVDWVLTIDHDSMFSQAHLGRLMTRFAESSLDAVAAVEARRGVKEVLGGATGRCLYGPHYQLLDTAHFGLTLLKVKNLARVPRPWFDFRPDPQGNWREGRTDADIWFWQQWKKAGNTVALDLAVTIGHLEELVSTVDQYGNKRFQTVQEWHEENRNLNAGKI